MIHDFKMFAKTKEKRLRCIIPMYVLLNYFLISNPSEHMKLLFISPSVDESSQSTPPATTYTFFQQMTTTSEGKTVSLPISG